MKRLGPASLLALLLAAISGVAGLGLSREADAAPVPRPVDRRIVPETGEPRADAGAECSRPSIEPRDRTGNDRVQAPAPRSQGRAGSPLRSEAAERPPSALELYREAIGAAPDPDRWARLEAALHSEEVSLQTWKTSLWAMVQADTAASAEALATYLDSEAPLSRRLTVLRQLTGMRDPRALALALDRTQAGPSSPLAVEAVRGLVRRSDWDPSVREWIELLARDDRWSGFVEELSKRG